MKIGVISDTHNKENTIIDALDIFSTEKVSYIIHCGDWTIPATVTFIAKEASIRKLSVVGVLGNRDFDKKEILHVNSRLADPINFPETATNTVIIDDKKGIIYHGHHKLTLNKIINSQVYDVVFTGHTHKPKVEKIGKSLIVNPGSTAFPIPRLKNSKATIAIYLSEKNEGKIIEYT